MITNEIKHFYYTELATLYGVNEAVILTNIIFWLRKNIKNDNNYKSGYYWTFNSVTSFSELFPEFTDRQIQYALGKLEKCGVIVAGKFNKRKYDKTKWYRLGNIIQRYYFGFEPEYYRKKPIDKFVKWIIQFCNIDLTKSLNAFDKIVKPIPYINTDNKQHIERKKPLESPCKENYLHIQNKWNAFANKHKLTSINKLSKSRTDKLSTRLKEQDFNFDKILEMIPKQKFLLGDNARNWKVDFDWIIENDNNYIKILENTYLNENRKQYYTLDGKPYEIIGGCIEVNGIKFRLPENDNLPNNE